MDLERQHVVIIGGASGIGLGAAKTCLEVGARVTLVGRTPGRLSEAGAQLGAEVQGVVADIAIEDDMRRLFEAGPVDHVMVTAAHVHFQRVRELDTEGAGRAVQVKVLGALHVAKHARFAPGGSLVLTAGINTSRPMPGVSAVAAGNGAVEALVRALAVELAPVRVNGLSPGWVDTPVWDVIAPLDRQARLDAQAARLLTGRVGTPFDLGRAAVFLMSNGFTTGEILHVDGGHRLV